MAKRVKRENADEGYVEKGSLAKKSSQGRKSVQNDTELSGSDVKLTSKEKKERKVYDLPGQKHDPLDERDPLRIFYESCYRQLPNSEMAQIWMMEHGLLDEEEALRVYNLKAKKNGTIKASPNSNGKVIGRTRRDS